jgi:thiol-disulfide isomerase/thioredoxin
LTSTQHQNPIGSRFHQLQILVMRWHKDCVLPAASPYIWVTKLGSMRIQPLHLLNRSLCLALGVGFLAWGVTLNGSAQNTLTVHVDGLSNDTVYLAHYYGAKLFYNDTAVANKQGTVVFQGKPFEEGGKYAVVVPGPKFFEFLMVDEPMEFQTTASNPSGDVKVLQSKENEVFYGYLNFIKEKRTQRAPFDEVLQDEAATEDEIASAKAAIQALTDEVNKYQHYLTNDPRQFLFGKYLTMVNEPTVPDTPDEVTDKAMWQYLWYRKHYWDRVDFSDPRLVRDGAFDQLISRYWAKVLPQIPDTMIAEAHGLLKKTLDAGNQDMFKYMLHHMTYASESSKIMCIDKVFVDLVNSYYRTGMVNWLSDEQLKKILDRADDLKHTLCGNRPPNITLPDLDQESWVQLYEVDAKYTLICIWESTCGHCKKEMPKLERIYDEWKPRGLEIFAIGNDFEPEPWQKYIREKEFTKWINVSDNPLINAQDSATALIYGGVTNLESLNFRTTFDVYATPKMFLLDADKKIVAKQVGATQLAEILSQLEGLQETVPYFAPEEKKESAENDH